MPLIASSATVATLSVSTQTKQTVSATTTTTLSQDDLAAITALEQVIVDAATPSLIQGESETRTDFVTRCLFAAGTAALSIAVKGPGGHPLWAKQYGVRRNAEGLAIAAKTVNKEFEIHPSITDPKEIEEHKSFLAKQRESILEASITDAADAIGFNEGPILSTTCFQAASISKPITAMAVMRLVQRGVLDLNRDIAEYLGDLWKLDVTLPVGTAPSQPTTLRHLLGHAAGTNVSGFGGYNRKQVRSGEIELPSTLGVLNGDGNSDKVEINCLPNTLSQYSGGGTTVAQLVVETVTGKPLSQVIHEEVVVPLGLSNTCATLEDSPNNGDFVCAHVQSECLPVPGGYHLYPETAAAGVWTTPMDLCKIQDAVFQSIHGNRVNGQVFLEPAHASEMISMQFALGPRCGLGVGYIMPDEFTFGHSGGNEGFCCDTKTFVKTGAGVSWMASSSWEVFSLMDKVQKAIAGVYGFDQGEGKPELLKPNGHPDPASLEECAGTFVLALSEGVFGEEFTRPWLRVERSDAEESDLMFHFGALVGSITCKRTSDQEDSAGLFSFKVMDRMDGKFTVRDNGETWFSFGGFDFVKQ
ncbi:hypothetical protein HDU98_000653 [Podochytrium sp. JEL0797]|nr:hypothetical protein HDU98_000653 [Podochytrium sp. JEL0797]